MEGSLRMTSNFSGFLCHSEEQSDEESVLLKNILFVGITMTYYVYILSDKLNRTIYTGVTNDLVRRVYEHRIHADPKSFTAQYDIRKLVYYEGTSDVRVALEREKQIKGWVRRKKNELVNSMNPQWEDLYESILG